MKALTILLILLCSVASAQVQLDNVQADNTHMSSYEKLFTFNPSTNTITGFTGLVNGHLTIPQTIRGVQVLHLGVDAFRIKDVKSVSLPSGLLTISDLVFFNYNATQTDLVIPSSVTLIGPSAFGGWPLTKITIGSDVTVGNGAMGLYGVSFKALYDANGKLAGTYVYEGSWAKIL
jgi:hypothetical protein